MLRSAPSLGFLISGSSRIYFAGDTDLFDEMSALAGSLDVALLPVSGWGAKVGPGHLDPVRAAQCLPLLKPRWPSRSLGHLLAAAPKHVGGSARSVPPARGGARARGRGQDSRSGHGADVLSQPHPIRAMASILRVRLNRRHGAAPEPSNRARIAPADGRARGCHDRLDGGVRNHRRHLSRRLRRHLPRIRVRVPGALRDGKDGACHGAWRRPSPCSAPRRRS